MAFGFGGSLENICVLDNQAWPVTSLQQGPAGLVEAGTELVEELMGALFPLFKDIGIFYVYVLDATTQAHILMEQ